MPMSDDAVAEAVRRLVADWPPLSDEQRTTLGSLLGPVRCDRPQDFGRQGDTTGEPVGA